MTHPVRFSVARAVLEARSPFVIGSHDALDAADVVPVEDANGLPMLPGTSLAGVLRHAVAGGNNPDADPRCQRLFGCLGTAEGRGQRSRLSVSHGLAHGAGDRPVAQPAGPAAAQDPVLHVLRAGVVRDHVRLDARGVVDTTGKFDERLVPAGARFTVELLLDTDGLADSDPGIRDLLDLLHDGGVRLGRSSGRGLGDLRVVRAQWGRFDLSTPADWERYRSLPVALHDPVPSGVLDQPWSPSASAVGAQSVWSVRLVPEDFVLVGQGAPFPEAERDAQLRPLRERRLVWGADRPAGAVTVEELVLPGSGLRGAMRHRAAFHARRRTGEWATAETDGTAVQAHAYEVALFGEAADTDGGQPGRLQFEDLRVPLDRVRFAVLPHVALDRFTQGPLDGALFSEQPAYLGGQSLETTVRMRPRRPSDAGRLDAPAPEDAVLLGVVEDVLSDLTSGRLQLGGGAARGHGAFRGSFSRTDSRES